LLPEVQVQSFQRPRICSAKLLPPGTEYDMVGADCGDKDFKVFHIDHNFVTQECYTGMPSPLPLLSWGFSLRQKENQ
jgi:hypothetical protein